MWNRIVKFFTGKKKLSYYMLKGLEIGKASGVKPIINTLIKLNADGEVCGACALGFALIGKYGIKKANRHSTYDLKTSLETNECLKDVCDNKKFSSGISVDNFTIILNDGEYATPEEIAGYLKQCNL